MINEASFRLTPALLALHWMGVPLVGSVKAPGQLGSLQEAPLLQPLMKLNAIAYVLHEEFR
jgi:hypothetical protein